MYEMYQKHEINVNRCHFVKKIQELFELANKLKKFK